VKIQLFGQQSLTKTRIRIGLAPWIPGLALKNPPKKTHPKKPKKKHLKKPLKMGFLGFFGFFKFLIFYENNTNFSLSNRFFMNK
jgi:hypothetical protein